MFSKDALKGQRILVTGGGSGLGKEMSRHFLKHGSEVVICGRRESVLQDTVKELAYETGGKISCFALDIRDSLAIENSIEELFAEKPITGLINNAAGNFISRTKTYLLMDLMQLPVLYFMELFTLQMQLVKDG